MASIKPIKAEYSAKLDGMAAYIRKFLSKNLSTEELLRTHKGIADFCYKNSTSFKKEFLHHVSLEKLRVNRRAVSENRSADFVSKLSEMDGECVFLLKDTHDVLELYQRKTSKGFGLLINRKFLCRTEEDYFALVKLVYDALANSDNIAEFSEKYFVAFRQLIENDAHFLDRAKKLFEYVLKHAVSDKIIFVDLGFQFTFSLFCSAAMRHFGNTEIDFYSYSIYPWLQTFFKDKYFSEKSETVLDLELRAMENFQSSLQNKAAGAFVGFAIGDALGFPVAGIDKSDVPKFINQEITGFTNNPKHPFFHHLKSGQYTENTNLLMISAQHLIKNRGFVPQKYQADLSKWGKKILTNPDAERWAGPTAINA
ncbi:ADP-ribosylglycohydrolase family protein, partial [bacterium]|nr:ADP-ribosylglycohydrolase family protein [bacterium]